MSLPLKGRLSAGVRRVFEEMGRHEKPYLVRVQGHVIEVQPGVFSPRYFADSKFFATRLPAHVGNRTLFEVGLGTGIVALFAALKGASSVAGSDINPMAVLNTQRNFERHGLCIDAKLGNVFDAFDASRKYDVVFWNHPFHNTRERAPSMLLQAGMDKGYAALEKYFRDGRGRLNPGGELMLGTSNIGRIRDILALAKKHRYSSRLIEKQDVVLSHRLKQRVDFRIYSFTPR